MKTFILTICSIVFLTGCSGGGSEGSSSNSAALSSTGLFLDGPVEGIKYTSKSHSGFTTSNGYFKYKLGEETTFTIGTITLGRASVNRVKQVITPQDIVLGGGDLNDTRVVEILRVLQSLDDDGNATNGIKLPVQAPRIRTIDLSSHDHAALSDDELASLLNIPKTDLKTEDEAKNHFSDTLEKEDRKETSYEDDLDKHDDEDDEDEHDEDYENYDTVTNPVVSTGTYRLLAWNDLGMHCFDGSDFSVFSILPPYNNLNAHLILKDGTSNKHISSGVTLSYTALDYQGSINTNSSGKTNFWDYLPLLFPGSLSTVDVGLTGYKTPSSTPTAMAYNATHNWWEADGIPIVNRDDDNSTNYYPMVRVTAKDTSGSVLATADVVLPVSDEMDCAKCHASTVTSTAAKPIAGWENDADALKDYKYNILKLHDEKHPINLSDLSALSAKGYDYNSSLYDTAKSGTPILCASCHSSNALGTTSIGNAQALTTSIHAKHASVIDPGNGLTLNSSSNRDSCYSCHPGAATECLRGAMGSAKDASGNQTMQCQSCHGTMSDVGNSSRTGWLDQPNCQVCHQNGDRHESSLLNGSLRDVLDDTFATNPNTPAPGVSLYRYSTGHGDLQCSSCHGSTHAIFPTSHVQDNIYSEQIQGHSGTVAECTSCHTTVPTTTTGGPHGMHTVGQNWVDAHEDVAERNAAQCTSCHGSDYRGSVLSKTFTNRSFNADGRTKTYTKGDIVGCYDCHGKEW